MCVCVYVCVISWARENECAWGFETCNFAAENGHLEVVKWAIGNGCPVDWGTWEKAAQRGQLPVLKWSRENGCEWDNESIYSC